MTTLQDGDIFISRWYEEEPNTSPGYWNHCAIYCDGKVVESLNDRGVLEWGYGDWLLKMQRVIVLRQSREDIAETAALYAPTLVGKPYRFESSIFFFMPWWRINKGLNCVSVVRLCYARAFRKDPLWRFPDDIVADERFYSVE